MGTFDTANEGVDADEPTGGEQCRRLVALWAAVFDAAIRDARLSGGNGSSRRRTALAWLTSDDTRPGGLSVGVLRV